jgi:hypothetical protein
MTFPALYIEASIEFLYRLPADYFFNEAVTF